MLTSPLSIVMAGLSSPSTDVVMDMVAVLIVVETSDWMPSAPEAISIAPSLIAMLPVECMASSDESMTMAPPSMMIPTVALMPLLDQSRKTVFGAAAAAEEIELPAGDQSVRLGRDGVPAGGDVDVAVLDEDVPLLGVRLIVRLQAVAIDGSAVAPDPSMAMASSLKTMGMTSLLSQT